MLWTMKPTIRNEPSVSCAEGERRPDREPLAEVVDADPDRDEQRERDAAHDPAAARAENGPRGTSSSG